MSTLKQLLQTKYRTSPLHIKHFRHYDYRDSTKKPGCARYPFDNYLPQHYNPLPIQQPSCSESQARPILPQLPTDGPIKAIPLPHQLDHPLRVAHLSPPSLPKHRYRRLCWAAPSTALEPTKDVILRIKTLAPLEGIDNYRAALHNLLRNMIIAKRRMLWRRTETLWTTA